MWLALLSVLLPILTISGRIIEDYQNDDYLEDYNEDNYDDENSEENKESETDRTPKFISSSKNFIVNEGDAIKLPCLVDNLENFLIMWKKGTKIVTLGDKPYENDDKRIQVENVWKEINITSKSGDEATERGKVQVGNTLVIRLSEEKDAGEYACQVSSAKFSELKHTVRIIVQPRIEPIPASRLVTVKAGDAAELSCKVTRGDPEPEVFWKRKDKSLPSGKASLPGTSITFPTTNRHHSGLYTCYADNKWREPASATIELDVQHAPEIEQQVMLVENQGETELRLICTVHASPMATVEWFKNNQLMIVKNNVISQRGNRHTLLLMGASKEDVTGKFECKAQNDLGRASAVLEMPFDAADKRLSLFKTDTSKEPEKSAINTKDKSEKPSKTATETKHAENADTVLDLKENDRTQHFQDKIKIPLEQNTDGIDLGTESVGSKKSDDKNKDKHNMEEGSGLSSSAENVDGDDVVAKNLDNTSQAKTDNREKVSPNDAQGKGDSVSKEVSNPEKLQDIPDTSACVKFFGNIFVYLILPVFYAYGH